MNNFHLYIGSDDPSPFILFCMRKRQAREREKKKISLKI